MITKCRRCPTQPVCVTQYVAMATPTCEQQTTGGHYFSINENEGKDLRYQKNPNRSLHSSSEIRGAMKRAFQFALLVLLTQTAFAATPKDVTFKSDGDSANAVTYVPEGKGPFPAVIVIHEWWGLNDWVRDQA